MARCTWCGSDPEYVAYHDEEWGVPVRSSVPLFEKLMLDAFQSGLSWLVVLRKRRAIINRLHLSNPQETARMTRRAIDEAMQDARIIRNRAKIEASVHNAKCFLQIQQSGSFSEFLWAHVGGASIINRRRSQSQIPPRSREGDAMARSLKAAGFKWTGPTVCHAFMQAVGMINDHVLACPRWSEVQLPTGGR
ncbi:MAG: DNA-3-methyladenine glycosylase I [Phycisphaerales bacterium]|nr:DNA-3-methyladenine glycosylase I [Phycisphaerales bacterium]